MIKVKLLDLDFKHKCEVCDQVGADFVVNIGDDYFYLCCNCGLNFCSHEVRMPVCRILDDMVARQIIIERQIGEREDYAC